MCVCERVSTLWEGRRKRIGRNHCAINLKEVLCEALREERLRNVSVWDRGRNVMVWRLFQSNEDKIVRETLSPLRFFRLTECWWTLQHLCLITKAGFSTSSVAYFGGSPTHLNFRSNNNYNVPFSYTLASNNDKDRSGLTVIPLLKVKLWTSIKVKDFHINSSLQTFLRYI